MRLRTVISLVSWFFQGIDGDCEGSKRARHDK